MYESVVTVKPVIEPAVISGSKGPNAKLMFQNFMKSFDTTTNNKKIHKGKKNPLVQ